MHKKLAKLKYLANNFKDLNYWNVELQEAYFSYKEAHLKNEELKKK